MVSFFGLKFGADKKKKEPEQVEKSLYAQQWKANREEALRQCSGMSVASSDRPSTSHGSQGGSKSNNSLMGDGVWDPHSTEFKAPGASFVGTSTSVSAGPSPTSPNPGLGLKAYGSEANLKLGMGARNGSSSSLAAPRLPFGGGGGGGAGGAGGTGSAGGAEGAGGAGGDGANGDTGPRPGSAHSMRQGQGKPFLEPLDIHILKESTPGISGPPRSPLGQFELMSPVSDNESLLGDEPEKIAKDITNRITQEEERAKKKAELEEKNRVQAELRAQAMKNVEATRPKTAGGYPSPPTSSQGERGVPSVLRPGQRPNHAFKGPAAQEFRPMSAGRDGPSSPSHLSPGPRNKPPATDWGRFNSRGRPPPGPEGSVTSPRAQIRGASAGSNATSAASRGRSQTTDNLTPGSSMLRPQASREPVRGATVPGVKPPCSPLSQQSSPLNLQKVDERSGDRSKLDSRAANAPYGIPSPPLSNGQRSSDEADGRPVIRTVQAKRDTLIIDITQRESLGLQIDEFEKSLQQAQAMTALEKGPDAVTSASGTRSRGNSDGSSNYSDISESPMTIEPPLISPQPFPLTPRPMSHAERPRSNAGEVVFAPPPRRPTLEERSDSRAGSTRSNTPVGNSRSNTADSMPPRKPTLEFRPDSPAGRPRVTGGAPPRRPTREEYGNIRINTVATMANRTRRPSPDEYDGRINRTESPIGTDSPILKNVRSVFSPDQASDVPSSTDTSRSNSPINSHSVFSPPPPARRVLPPKPIHTEWHLGPAPTAPPTAPLPIPERNARRKNTADTASQKSPGKLQSPSDRKASPAPSGLGSSANIVPDLFSNPNWPLPGPGGPAGTTEAGFGARRSLLPDKRAPPTPLNIAATRYADDIGSGPLSDPSTLDTDAPENGLGFTPIQRPKTAGAQKEDVGRKDSLTTGNMGFVWGETPITAYNTAEMGGDVAEQPAKQPATVEVEDKSSAIGMARGLSLKYDRIREQEKKTKAKERMKAMKAWTIDESSGPTSPAESQREEQPLGRMRRPNDGLKSPTGIADEHGTGFI